MEKSLGFSLLEVIVSLSLFLLTIMIFNEGFIFLMKKQREWHKKAEVVFIERQKIAYEQGMEKNTHDHKKA